MRIYSPELGKLAIDIKPSEFQDSLILVPLMKRILDTKPDYANDTMLTVPVSTWEAAMVVTTYSAKEGTNANH
jgi:hypothetical protein